MLKTTRGNKKKGKISLLIYGSIAPKTDRENLLPIQNVV